MSDAFDLVPQPMKSREPLPVELTRLVDKSLEQFDESLGAMRTVAKLNGWYDRYRKEATELVRTAYTYGKTGALPTE